MTTTPERAALMAEMHARISREAKQYVPLLTDLCGKVDPVAFVTNSDDYPAVQKKPMAEWIAGWLRGVCDATGIRERALWTVLSGEGKGKEPGSKPNTSPKKLSTSTKKARR